jgi:hypothetical protein
MENDCHWGGIELGPKCADIDNDGRKECAGELTMGDGACVNATSMCPNSAPICENGKFGTGERGLSSLGLAADLLRPGRSHLQRGNR